MSGTCRAGICAAPGLCYIPRTVGWVILAHLGIPVFFGVAFLIFTIAVAPPSEGWETLLDASLDLTILSLGATGAIFDNAKVAQTFGANSALVAVTVIAVDLIAASILVLIRARTMRSHVPVSGWHGIIALFIGMVTLLAPIAVIVWSYTRGGGS
jgi:hypothetical protein